MKILVTGGTGFIGSHLAAAAIEKGIDVNVLGLTHTDADRINAEKLAAMGAQVFSGSIADAELCRNALAGVTHVQHLAVAMREAGVSDDYFRQVNLDGTRTLLDACHEAGVQRFIYCGTIGIFGHSFEGVANEDSPKSPGNIYEQTKLAAESLTLEYGRDIGIDCVSIRPADVYGPGDQRLRKLFAGVARGRFPLFGQGAGRRHMVFISDVVSAFDKALTSEKAIGRALIVAGPEVCTLAELIEAIRQAAGSSSFGVRLPLRPMLSVAAIVEDVCTRFGIQPPIYRRRMDFFTSDAAFDISRAMSTLNWEPVVGLQEGVERTLASYQAFE